MLLLNFMMRSLKIAQICIKYERLQTTRLHVGKMYYNICPPLCALRHPAYLHHDQDTLNLPLGSKQGTIPASALSDYGKPRKNPVRMAAEGRTKWNKKTGYSAIICYETRHNRFVKTSDLHMSNYYILKWCVEVSINNISWYRHKLLCYKMIVKFVRLNLYLWMEQGDKNQNPLLGSRNNSNVVTIYGGLTVCYIVRF